MSSILITGANRGIGLELARAYGKDKWQVFACCRHPEQAGELKKLERMFRRLSVYRLDLKEESQIEDLAGNLSGEPLDILFNNAGIFGPAAQGFGETEVEGWLETFRVNTIAPLRMAEALVENVAASERRVVAFMGSVMGSVAENSSGGSYAYRTSKAAVHMVMKGLSVDLRERGITSVAFHPGWVKTRMGGENAPVAPVESARGLKKVLDGLSIEQSGSFFDYQGERRPW